MTSSTGRAPAAAAPSTQDPKRWLALVVIGAAQLMIVLDATIVNVALPSAQRDLGISDVNRQWLVTAYTVAFGGLLLLGGRVADFMGRKRTLLIGLLGFAAASGLGGLATNAGLLFGARALQGAFGAMLAPAALSLIAVTFTEPRERARAFGVFGAIAGGGAAVGQVLGGVLTEYASWRWCLGVNVPIALLTALAAVPVVRESRAPGDTRYDVPGAVLATGGLVALVYGFTEAAKQDVGWTAGRTLGILAAAGILLAAFVLREARTANPLLPLRIALDRNRGGCYLVLLLVGAALFGMFLFLTYYLQISLGYSPVRTGLAFLPFSAGVILTAGAVSQLLPRTGPKPLMAGGLAMGLLGMLWLTRIPAESSFATHVLPAEMLLSTGIAGVLIAASSTALVGVGAHDAGVASALVNTSQQIGGSLGTALLNTLYTSAVTAYLTGTRGPVDPRRVQLDASLHGYRVAFFWAAMLLVAALAAAVALVSARRADVRTEPALAAA